MRLPFSDDSFVLVVSSLVLIFVPDGALAAAEIARVAKLGGVVATATRDLRGGVITARMPYDTSVALGVPAAESWRARQLGGPGSAPASSRNCGARPVCAMCGRGKSPSAWISPTSPTIGSPRSRAHYCPAFSMGYPPIGTSVSAAAVERAFLVGDADGPRSLAATAWVIAGMR